MKTLGLLILYFGLGLAEDYLVSWYYFFLGRKEAAKTAGISLVHTLLAVFVVASIIVSNDVWLLLAYAGGGAVGTYIGVKHGKSKPHITTEEYRCGGVSGSCCGKLPPVMYDDGYLLTCYDYLFETFEALRAALGRPLIITSGYRCAKHNAEVGGEPMSPTAMACD